MANWRVDGEVALRLWPGSLRDSGVLPTVTLRTEIHAPILEGPLPTCRMGEHVTSNAVCCPHDSGPLLEQQLL